MLRFVACSLLVLAPALVSAQGQTLKEARQGFKTKLTKRVSSTEQLPRPPRGFKVVRYRSPVGELKALLSLPRDASKKHPAIVWITGGFPSGGIGESAWKPVSSQNDQSAKVYRLQGMVMMYPTLRGTYGNPGAQESFLGEVDDVIAAGEYLRKQPFVDPDRIYLGGHSTGGTLVLLVAEMTNAFKAVFSFGPASDPLNYGSEAMLFDTHSKREARVRAPIRFLDGITTPTWVIEGEHRSRLAGLRAMEKRTTNTKVRFVPVLGANHFDVLAPVNALLAQAIRDGELTTVDRLKIQRAYTQHQVRQGEASDLETIAGLRRRGLPLDREVTVRHYVLGREAKALETIGARLKKLGEDAYRPQPLKRREDRRGRPFFILVVTRRLKLEDLKRVFVTSRAVKLHATGGGAQYDGWDAKE